MGGPTQGHGVSPALQRWLDGLDRLDGLPAAAFDTRLARPRWVTGSAARTIARRLERLGCRPAAEPGSFLVEGTEGPLLDGELDRAARWAEALAADRLPATTEGSSG